MRNVFFSLTALAALSAPTIAQVQPVRAPVTGVQVIIALAKARGLTLSAAQVNAITLKGAAFINSPAFASLALQLRVSDSVLNSLVSNASAAVSPTLAFRALLEATTGKAVSEAAAEAFLAKHPELKDMDVASFGSAVSDPTVLADVNSIARDASRPVTARGGGN